MVDLSPEDKARIYAEEKVRIEAQVEVQRELQQRNAQQVFEQKKKSDAAFQRGCFGCITLPFVLLILLLWVCTPNAKEQAQMDQQQAAQKLAEKEAKKSREAADRKAHPAFWHYKDLWGNPPTQDDLQEYLFQDTEVYNGRSAFPESVSNQLKIYSCSKSYIGTDGYLIHATYYALGGNNVPHPGDNENWFTFKHGKVIDVEEGDAHPELK